MTRPTVAAFILAALILGGCTGMPPAGDATQNKTLAARVKAALIRDSRIDAAAIGVTADAGRVRLNGFVESELERRRAERTAGSVEGVTGITNQIQVK